MPYLFPCLFLDVLLNSYLKSYIFLECVDADGKCQPIGASGFSADVNGILQTDCRCEAADDNILIRCKKAPTTP